MENAWVRLEVFEERHRQGLRAASLNDEEVWRYSLMADFEPWFDASLLALKTGDAVPFAVRRLSDNALVGTTRYLNLAPEHRRLEIGNTWYSALGRRTFVNAATKWLMLERAFTEYGAARVEFKVDARNTPSRRAMQKLGAVEEGTLRKHIAMSTGYLRDSVYFSILAEEWPAVRARLAQRLGG